MYGILTYETTNRGIIWKIVTEDTRTPIRAGAAAMSRNLRSDLTGFVRPANPIRVQIESANGLVAKVWVVDEVWEGVPVAAAAPPHRAVNQRGGGGHAPAGQRAAHQHAGAGDQNRGHQPTAFKFQNPYNFVGFDENPMVVASRHAPKGHDRYLPGYWSGRIPVRLEVKTPLLLPAEPVPTGITGHNGHKAFGVRRHPADPAKPYIPETQIRGMLRSAYEAVTQSRFGVFSRTHDQRLARRHQARDGLSFVPARVEAVPGGGHCLVLLQGTNAALPPNNGTLPNNFVYAASQELDPPPPGGVRAHGAPVTVLIQRHTHRKFRNGVQQPDYDFWLVISSASGHSARPPEVAPSPQVVIPPHPPANKTYLLPVGGPIVVNGYYFASGRNIGRKHYERVFFSALPGGAAPQRIPIDEPIRSMWRDVIDNYQANEELRKGRAAPSVPGASEWSRHMGNGVASSAKATLRELSEGTLLYARVNGKEVLALSPVQIGRELYCSAPGKLLSETFRPARELKELSPADRVFGWVAQKDGRGAYKGQLRIGPVSAVETKITSLADASGRGMPLAILSRPKPAQARFYTCNANGAPFANQTRLNNAPPAFDRVQSHRLRGWKVYPHHAGLPADYWQHRAGLVCADGRAREYLHPSPQEDLQRGDQNRSFTEWVEPGSTFALDLEVINLSDDELDALLYLFCLPADGFHRLGYGKPLGFGSIRLDLGEGVALQNGEAIAHAYRTAFGPMSAEAGSAAHTISATATAIERANQWQTSRAPSRSALRAFERMAKGDGSSPTHYPRREKRPDGQGENFRWFTENERRQEPESLPLLSGSATLSGFVA